MCPSRIIANNDHANETLQLLSVMSKRMSVRKILNSLPAICFQNGLALSAVPQCLELTDLECQLIAKNLVFIKISPTPRSRYDVMNGRIVNVPINDDDIIKK